MLSGAVVARPNIADSMPKLWAPWHDTSKIYIEEPKGVNLKNIRARLKIVPTQREIGLSAMNGGVGAATRTRLPSHLHQA